MLLAIVVVWLDVAVVVASPSIISVSVVDDDVAIDNVAAISTVAAFEPRPNVFVRADRPIVIFPHARSKDKAHNDSPQFFPFILFAYILSHGHH